MKKSNQLLSLVLDLCSLLSVTTTCDVEKNSIPRNPRKKHCRDLAIRDTVLIKDSDDKITDDQQDVRKVRVSEALDSLYELKCFAEIHGDKHMNVMIN